MVDRRPRLNFQFGTEVGYEIKNGQLGRLLRNPTYTGIGPQFWRSMDMLVGDRGVGHAQLRQGATRSDRPHRPPGRAGPVPQRSSRGAGMIAEPEIAGQVVDLDRSASCPAPRPTVLVDATDWR